jgi:multidrug efflux system membrane fusion protein
MRSLINHVAAGTTLALALAGCSGKEHTPGTTQTQPSAVITGLTIETVKSAPVTEMQELAGTVHARTSAVISARIAGTVSMLRVREGDRVLKGQLLAQLDAQENQANAAAASAGIDEARRGLDEALSRKHLTDTTFERYQKLFTEQAISRQEFDVKQSERDLAAQGVARAEARLKKTQEGARATGIMADYTRITSPLSGIITRRQADLGATVFPGQPLMTIEDEGNYQLELAIPENLASLVRSGTPVQVTLDSLGRSFAAQIVEIVPSADPASRTFTAKVPLAQKGLKSGMFGRGALSLGRTVNGMLVARKALVERGAMTSVWIVDREKIARMRLVKVGKTVGDRVEILSGLSDDERIVVDGVEKVSEGSKVE